MGTQKSLGKRDLGITAQSQRSSEILMKRRRRRGQSLENQHLRNKKRKRGKPGKETKKSIRVVEKKKKNRTGEGAVNRAKCSRKIKSHKD